MSLDTCCKRQYANFEVEGGTVFVAQEIALRRLRKSSVASAVALFAGSSDRAACASGRRWNSYSVHNALTLTTSLLYHPLFEC